MIKMADLDKSQFNICSSFTLSWDDINCLVLLYQPIIGPEAMALYFTFNSLILRKSLDSETFSHIFLYDMLGYDTKKFLKLRQILEAIGLITTYYNDDSYVYLLSSPLSPKRFLSDGVLGVMLCSKVGMEVFNQLRSSFKVVKLDKKKYQNVTVSFDDVFSVDTKNDLISNDSDNYLINKKNSRNIKISNYDFDMNVFLNDIDQSLIETGPTDEFKAKIMETAKVYSFDEGDMAGLFLESLNNAGYFDDKLLKRKAKILYTYKYKKDLPSFSNNKEINGNEEIFAIENASGEDFLQSILGSSFKNEDLNTLNELNNILNLNPSVIRILIMHVIRILKGKETVDNPLRMPPISYFKKVADDWILEGTTDVYTAYNKYVLGIDNDSSKSKKVYKKKTPIRKKDKYEIENEHKDAMEGMEVL